MRRLSTLALVLVLGCAGGETTPATSFTSTSGVGSQETDTDVVISATDAPGDGGADGSSGEPDPSALPGIGAAGLVSAGGRASSANYAVVFTMGQSSVPVGNHASSSYTLRGGIVGANGSPPQ